MGEIFRTYPDRPWGPPRLLYNGYRVFPGCKERPVRDADPSSPSSVVVMKKWSYTSTPPMGRTACTKPQCLYNGALYFTYSGSVILDGAEPTFTCHNVLLLYERGQRAESAHRQTDNVMLSQNLFDDKESVEYSYVSC